MRLVSVGLGRLLFFISNVARSVRLFLSKLPITRPYLMLIHLPDHCHPMASLGSMASLGIGGILLRRGNFIFLYDFEVNGIREDEMFDMSKVLLFFGPGGDTLGRVWENVSWSALISLCDPAIPKNVCQIHRS